MSDATFEKYVYGQTKKLNSYPLRIMIPDQKSTADTHMKKFLDAVSGKGLGVSLLLDPPTWYWGENTQPDVLPPDLPSIEQLERTIVKFKKSLNVTMQQVREIEVKYEVSVTLLNGLQLVATG